MLNQDIMIAVTCSGKSLKRTIGTHLTAVSLLLASQPSRDPLRGTGVDTLAVDPPGSTDIKPTGKFLAADLELQWESYFETAALWCERGWLLDSFFRAHFSQVMEGILERTEYQHMHFVEPEDFGLVVGLAEQVVQRWFTRASSTGCI
ncbi:hypothetical protein BO82DRAFT_398047 [Aspergillus uvarum CBS 121591]|uniref:Uncharacterized protein n=1 Tax=Aspergillus uvarum CBS 121591 TaxID=1448315 RepID=A0A319CPF2_9EURO|nr:hypothetical protein BO82DRAFT_398047 [Aspergillus uvarum CBS 121591]PYH86299.1 hypothetical protein BO82DRAFT_398047 [Aspergillus uvarum CBS 121591]